MSAPAFAWHLRPTEDLRPRHSRLLERRVRLVVEREPTAEEIAEVDAKLARSIAEENGIIGELVMNETTGSWVWARPFTNVDWASVEGDTK